MKTLLVENTINTPEFKQWFLGSKVVDKSGDPLIVKHWTFNDFTVFDRLAAVKLFKRDTQAPERIGHWFTDSDEPKLYGEKEMKLYLSIKNPKIYDHIVEKKSTGKQLFDDIVKFGGADKFRELLHNMNYDGIIVKNSHIDGYNQNVYVTLEPYQVKSAMGNSGEFNSNNPDITKEEQI